MKTTIFLNLVVFLIAVSTASAATRLVPSEYPTIQAAIYDSNDGDIVAVADGTYTGDGNRDIDFFGKAITVCSEKGPMNCIIDCQGTTIEPHRGYHFHSQENEHSILKGFTIINGYANKLGGAIYCDYSSPAIMNCIFKGNASGLKGGAVHSTGSKPRLTNCIFSENTAQGGGGLHTSAVYGSDQGPIMVNCTFTKNFANNERGGGGVYCDSTGRTTLNSCILRDNKFKYGGGQNAQVYLPNPVVNYCCIEGLTGSLGGTDNIDADPLFADANGGDYHLRYGSPCINAGTNNPPGGLPETDLDGNPRIINGIVDMGAYEFERIWHVDGVNGDDNNDGLSPETAFATIQKGIDSAEDEDVVWVYPGVYQETIDFLGKAIMVKSAEDAAVLEAQDYFAVLFYSGEDHNSVLKNFVVRNSFIAIFLEGSSPTISNVTVADNAFGIAAYAGAEPDISNSIFWNNIYGDLFGCEARYSCIQEAGEGQGNLNIDPLFAAPENGDYHLLSRRGRYWPEHNVWVLDDVISPCIDGGDPNADYFNEPRPNGGRVNMGAYGGTAYASMKEMRWVHSDINHDGWVNMIDFAKLAENWLTYQPGTSNYPPEVYITKPEDGSLHGGREPIEIEADAWDIDGLVEKVEFFANENKIGEDNNGNDGWKTYWEEGPPWSGDYNLTTKATDDDLATTTSPEVEIRVDSIR